MAERKIHNFKSNILYDLTLEKEGFDPRLVGYQKKHIYATCRFCGEPHRIKGCNLKKSGSACHKDCRLKEQSISGSPFSNKDIKEKAQKNRTKNVSQEEINKRISIGRKKAQSKIEKTNLKKYGVKNQFQSEEIKEKIRHNHIKNYGVAHPMKSQEVRDRFKNTMQDKYGVDNPLQNEEIKEKVKETNLKKYGSKNPMQNNEIKKKALHSFNETVLSDKKRYKLINTLRDNSFWEEMSKKELSLEELCNKFNIHYSSATSRLLYQEFNDKYYSTYHFPKQQEQMYIANEIKKMGLHVDINNRSIISPLELDIYVPSCKLAIEYNGSYWHSEAILKNSSARNKHFDKTESCSKENIFLIHIFEHNWINNKDKYLNYIKSKVGLNQHYVGARKCSLNNSMQKEFIEKNHIQGYGNRTIKYFNLEHEGMTLASMTFSKHHRKTKENIIVLNRLCFKDNTTVQGGASKLFKAAKNWAIEEGYNKIISWSDNSWTSGDIYNTLGFKLEENFGPDYFYYDTNSRCYKSKQSQKKSATGCPKDKTERDWCIQRGLYRIWDCGKKRWSYEL